MHVALKRHKDFGMGAQIPLDRACSQPIAAEYNTFDCPVTPSLRHAHVPESKNVNVESMFTAIRKKAATSRNQLGSLTAHYLAHKEARL